MIVMVPVWMAVAVVVPPRAEPAVQSPQAVDDAERDQQHTRDGLESLSEALHQLETEKRGGESERH